MENNFDIYKNTDVFIGRAGANTLSELAYFQIKSILVPLPLTASRGEQFQNAQAFVKAHPGKIIMQDELELSRVHQTLQKLLNCTQNNDQPPQDHNTNQLLFSRLSHFLSNDRKPKTKVLKSPCTHRNVKD